MNDRAVTEKEILKFESYLRNEERGNATVEKYLREVRFFSNWLSGRMIARESVIEWKEYLQKEGYVPATVNAKLSALNSFFSFMGWEDYRVKLLRVHGRNRI